MSVPSDRKYAESHEWARVEGSIAYIGISDHAQDSLGEIVFVEIPETGEEVKKGDEVTTIESVKAASAIYTPVSGTVVKVNEAIEDTPEAVNEDAYGTFIFAVEMSDPSEIDAMLDSAAYTAQIESEED